MPSSRYYRYPIFEKEQRRKRRKKIAVIAFASIFVILFLWFVYLSPVFEIRNFQISSSDKISEADARQFVADLKFYSKLKFLYNLLPGFQNNLIFLPKNKLAENLTAAFPEIKNLKINKKPLHTLKLSFDSRKPLGIWCDSQNRCFYIDGEGVIFDEAPESEGALVMKIKDSKNPGADPGARVADASLLNFFLEFREGLFKAKKISITLYKIADLDYIEAQTQEGWTIRFQPSGSPSIILGSLVSTLNEIIKVKQKNLEYIDLRIPDRIFYKLK